MSIPSPSRYWLPPVLWFALVAAVGCGPSNGKPQPPEVESFIREWRQLDAEIECRATLKCDQIPPSEVPYETVEACVRGELQKGATLAPASVREGVQRGRLEYDSRAARQCLEQLRSDAERSDACKALKFVRPTCLEALTGTVPEGEPCELGMLECVEGSVCQRVDGKCYGRCNSITRAGDGKSCDDGDRTESCAFSQNLICATEGGDSDGHVCAKVDSRAKGEPCEDDLVCQRGLACSDGTCQTFSVVGEGTTCQTDGNRCRPGLACRLRPQGRPQTCGPFAGEGEPCFPEDCRDGLACESPKPGPEVCRPKQQKGKSCRFSFQCQKGLACVPAPSGDGEVCLPPAENVYERCPLPDAS